MIDVYSVHAPTLCKVSATRRFGPLLNLHKENQSPHVGFVTHVYYIHAFMDVPLLSHMSTCQSLHTAVNLYIGARSVVESRLFSWVPPVIERSNPDIFAIAVFRHGTQICK